MKIDQPLEVFANFKGLYTKNESGLVPSNPEVGVFASEIQNVECTDGTISLSKGYGKEVNEEDSGTAEVTYSESDDTHIDGAYSYKTFAGGIRRLLFLGNGKVLAYNPSLDKYELLVASGVSNPNFGYITYYKATSTENEQHRTYFGTAQDAGGKCYVWNNAMATFASATSSTIVMSSSADFDQSSGNVILEGTTYAYTGVSGGTTLTGVTPDPTSAGHTVSAYVMQEPDLNPSYLSTAMGANPDIFKVYGGRLICAYSQSTQLAGSAVGDPEDFTTTGVGGRFLANIGDGNGPLTALEVLGDFLICFKEDGVIPVRIVQSSGTTEVTQIKPIALRADIGPAHKSITHTSDKQIMYVSADKEIKAVSIVNEDNALPELVSISDTILPTLKGFEYDLGRATYHDKSWYLACREGSVNDTVIEYDTVNKTFYFHKKPVGCWFDVDTKLHFGQAQPIIQTYYWKSQSADDDGAISYLWRSGRLPLGEVFKRKKLKTFMAVMRMTQNSTFTFDIDYNRLGSLHTVSFDVAGDGSSTDNGSYVISDPNINTYGRNQYGIEPYGSAQSPDADGDYVDVIVYKSLNMQFAPYDVTVQVTAHGDGQRGQVIAFGFLPYFLDGIPKHHIV